MVVLLHFLFLAVLSGNGGSWFRAGHKPGLRAGWVKPSANRQRWQQARLAPGRYPIKWKGRLTRSRSSKSKQSTCPCSRWHKRLDPGPYDRCLTVRLLPDVVPLSSLTNSEPTTLRSSPHDAWQEGLYGAASFVFHAQSTGKAQKTGASSGYSDIRALTGRCGYKFPTFCPRLRQQITPSRHFGHLP